MRIYLIGNGLDLRYGLATKYENFLHTLSFLLEHRNTAFQSVGQVFRDEELLKQDPTIKASYEKYGDAYNKVLLDPQKVSEIINKAQNNMWFSYLRNTMFTGKRWIDFEKEIAQVLELLEYGLANTQNNGNEIALSPHIANNQAITYILHCFNYFWVNATSNTEIGIYSYYAIKDEYLIESPAGSGRHEINQNAIAQRLFDSLIDLADCLKLYLQCFVENAVYQFAKQGIIQTDCRLIQEDESKPFVVSLNYTHTWETLYPNATVCHVHGETNKQIVLGINSNKHDTLAALNTVFIQFKKYYQRVVFFSDVDYLCNIRDLKAIYSRSLIILHVIGHSLDVTDKDIIQELFGIAHRIYIFYHNETSLQNYIANLISIYGKEEFDRLRFEKNLSFVKTDLLNKE